MVAVGTPWPKKLPFGHLDNVGAFATVLQESL